MTTIKTEPTRQNSIWYLARHRKSARSNFVKRKLKRVVKLSNGFELTPDSADPTFRPTVYDYNEPGTDPVTIIGRVVFYVLPFDWEF